MSNLLAIRVSVSIIKIRRLYVWLVFSELSDPFELMIGFTDLRAIAKNEIRSGRSIIHFDSTVTMSANWS